MDTNEKIGLGMVALIVNALNNTCKKSNNVSYFL